MCAVYGPGEVKIMKELAERAYVNVVYKPRIGVSSKSKSKLTNLNSFLSLNSNL